METLELIDPVQPEAPNPANVVEFEFWKLVVNEHQTNAKEYANFKAGLYNLVFGQCTDALQEQLKSHTNFQAANKNGIALLVIIHNLIHTFEEQRKLSVVLADVEVNFYCL